MADPIEAAAQVRLSQVAKDFLLQKAVWLMSQGDERGPTPSQYTLDRRLGSGTFGEAWEGTDVGTGKPVVVKMLKQRDTSAWMAEIDLLSRTTHPNIVDILDVVCSGGRQGIVLEHAGVTLKTYYTELVGPVVQWVGLSRQLLDGVRFLHSRSLIHCDLKPGNVAVQVSAGQPTLRIIDFGGAVVNIPGYRTEEEGGSDGPTTTIATQLVAEVSTA